MRELTRKLQSTRRETQRLGRESSAGVGRERLSWPSPSVSSSASPTGEFQSHAAEHLEALTAAAQDVAGEPGDAVATGSSRSPTWPTRAVSWRRTSAGEPASGIESSRAVLRTASIVGFEGPFRGPEALIRDRQRGCICPFSVSGPASSISAAAAARCSICSRRPGVPARGVDPDPDMVRHCRDKGHSVEQMDALEFLREHAPASLPAVFSAQVIEHLTLRRAQGAARALPRPPPARWGVRRRDRQPAFARGVQDVLHRPHARAPDLSGSRALALPAGRVRRSLRGVPARAAAISIAIAGRRGNTRWSQPPPRPLPPTLRQAPRPERVVPRQTSP